VYLSLVVTIALGAMDQPAKDPRPDPGAMLRAVADARLRIASGSMDLEVSHYRFDQPKAGTNHIRLLVVFDGPKRRVEQFSREKADVLMGPDAGKVTEAKLRELEWNFEAFVRLGLGQWIDIHTITAYDGSVVLQYREQDRKGGSTVIRDPAKGDYGYVFDPRILGLSPNLSFRDMVEHSLADGRAENVRLVGKETVEGHAAWHVEVQWPAPNPWTRDYWIDADQPTHVLKTRTGPRDIVVARYDEGHNDDPLPTEVVEMSYQGNTPWIETRIVRRNSHYHGSIDPDTWTLAGLGMPVGTPVSDIRIPRRIGYWNGTGLSKDSVAPASRAAPPVDSPSNAKNLMAVVEKELASDLARESAIWVILNTPDGPEVDRAADIIIQHHAADPALASFCSELADGSPRSAPKLLRTVITANRDPQVQAFASFALAIILKRQAAEGTGAPSTSEQAAIEAEGLFERVIAEHGQIASNGTTLAERAKPELFELRTLGVGKVAPDIEGEDLDGRKLKLSDYRGKVVVLTFWGTWCGACMEMVPDERKLVESMQEKPFAMLGVNSDADRQKVKVTEKKEKITWPSFWDGATSGPIAKTWNVHSWPTIYVVDRGGVIRHRDLYGQALIDAVAVLVNKSP